MFSAYVFPSPFRCRPLAPLLTPPIQVPPDATEAQLKSAYKKGALKHHPGKREYAQP